MRTEGRTGRPQEAVVSGILTAGNGTGEGRRNRFVRRRPVIADAGAGKGCATDLCCVGLIRHNLVDRGGAGARHACGRSSSAEGSSPYRGERFGYRPAMTDESNRCRREVVSNVRSVVVKVGTNVLSRTDDSVDEDRIASLAEQLASLRMRGLRVVLVSSGAVGAGLGVMGRTERPTALPELQAAAALGQARLIGRYDEALGRFGLHAAQLLLTGNDFKDRRRYLNARNTLSALAEIDCIPIVNENDTVSIREIRFGDNDRLAALVTSLMPSPLLILLTTADGLLDGPPDSPESRRIPYVGEWTEELRSVATADRSRRGTGGMRSKLDAVRMATSVGEHVVIADGRRENVIKDVVAGEDVGTLFAASANSMPAWKRWIAQAVPPSGKLQVNEGAARAVVAEGRSLLAVGVTSVDGAFERGDVVSIVSAGREIARGLSQYGVTDAKRIAGLRSGDFAAILGDCPYGELVHRDNLVTLPLG